jgi:hypothetical protein
VDAERLDLPEKRISVIDDRKTLANFSIRTFGSFFCDSWR